MDYSEINYCPYCGSEHIITMEPDRDLCECPDCGASFEVV